MNRDSICAGRPPVAALFLVLALFAGRGESAVPHGAMLRTPDVSATEIVFRYANDLWLVSRDGGEARPLASPPGAESFPRFSPDGAMIAFMGNYDGNTDIYTLPAAGGVPFRVTYHPARENLCDWTNDGRLLFNVFGMGEHARTRELYSVSPRGGLPEKMPVPYGGIGSISDDGRTLAYVPYTRDHRSWKRYAGGMATDIWLFDLKNKTARRITDWEGTDSFPMWRGSDVFYLSDAGVNHRLNIWVFDTVSGNRRQVTHHDRFDVKWPAMGPGPAGKGEIVYQVGAHLALLDLDTEKERTVTVTIPGDMRLVREQAKDASELIFGSAVSPSGKRAVVGARGDIWTLPAKNGSPVNLTRTDSVAERTPVWSADGKWIAWFSDATGEYELYIAPSDGRGEVRKLTHRGKGFCFMPTWSPDSKWISYWDETGRLYIQNIENGTSREVAKSFSDERNRVSWSSDSKWLAFTNRSERLTPEAIWLYSLENDEKTQVTAGMFGDTWPTFDREGKYLFFASYREFTKPKYEDVGTTWIYSDTDRLYVVPLQVGTASPFAPQSDEETWDEEDDGEKKDEDGEKEEDAKKGDDEGKDDESVEPVKIDVAGFEKRAIELPVDRGGFVNLAVNSDGKLLYGRISPAGSGGKGKIEIFDMEEKEEDKREKTVLEGTTSFVLSADGKKLLVRKGHGLGIIDASADQDFEAVPTSGMTVWVHPRREWRQIFRDVWRMYRDRFYDPNMHGVDWDGVGKQYGAMIEDCASRWDVSFVIREMIAELNVGHAYYFGGDYEDEPSMSVGMLGCDFELHDGAYRISRIIAAADWDVDGRGVLGQPGVDVKEGDYLLAVNGVPVDPARSPWAAFQGLAGRTVTLTVSEDARLDDDDRRVVVKLLEREYPLRFRAWVEKNREYVEKKSKGRVGYIYVPNTGVDGQNELVRQFYGQLNREALIIDERWNGGGQIPTRFIELLNRPAVNYWAERYRKLDEPWPPDAHQGPKCMLINGLAGSGGDYFPFLFRKAGLGKLIGTRTWGGLVGISGSPRLIDGGMVTVPRFAFYRTGGTWGIEGYGVAPDIEVVDDPSLMTGGRDPQLDAAIDEMLKELESNPFHYPQRPEYPDRSGMIVPEEQR